jgi:hypothetical protein
MLGEKMKRFSNHYIIEMLEDEMNEMFDSGQLTSIKVSYGSWCIHFLRAETHKVAQHTHRLQIGVSSPS